MDRPHFNLYIKPNGDIIDLDELYPYVSSPHYCYWIDNDTDDETLLDNGWLKTSLGCYAVIWNKRLTKKQKEVLTEKLLEWNECFDYKELDAEYNEMGIL